MSYISHELQNAVVTWKNDSYEHHGNGPFCWPFADEVTKATVVGVAFYDGGHGHRDLVLVLKAPNGDLAQFVAEGARVVESRSSKDVIFSEVVARLVALESRVAELASGPDDGEPARQGCVTRRLDVPRDLWEAVKAESAGGRASYSNVMIDWMRAGRAAPKGF